MLPNAWFTVLDDDVKPPFVTSSIGPAIAAVADAMIEKLKAMARHRIVVVADTCTASVSTGTVHVGEYAAR